ncbi:hypothetical protein NEFER01_1447 [Nematocida sp. LUAm1]|nr:hypothetical protein NEFER02_1653 [Nematocida sp. LUAm2]KAI5178280.1 hypothetical protein NEFER01_1447 [Nematocida sp. LUAm1]
MRTLRERLTQAFTHLESKCAKEQETETSKSSTEGALGPQETAHQKDIEEIKEKLNALLNVQGEQPLAPLPQKSAKEKKASYLEYLNNLSSSDSSGAEHSEAPYIPNVSLRPNTAIKLNNTPQQSNPLETQSKTPVNNKAAGKASANDKATCKANDNVGDNVSVEGKADAGDKSGSTTGISNICSGGAEKIKGFFGLSTNSTKSNAEQDTVQSNAPNSPNSSNKTGKTISRAAAVAPSVLGGALYMNRDRKEEPAGNKKKKEPKKGTKEEKEEKEKKASDNANKTAMEKSSGKARAGMSAGASSKASIGTSTQLSGFCSPPADTEPPKNINQILEKIRKQGSLLDDKRFYKLISESIETLKKKEEFEAIKASMYLDIARKYIYDFIELRRALEKK